MAHRRAPLFHLENVTKRYGTRTVLDIADLTIQQGELLALVGPSGAGKSTLLRLLNFLEPPSSGAIRFQDHSVNAERPAPLAAKRRVTTVFQRPALLSRTVYANVKFGLQMRGLRNTDEAIRSALHQVGLTELAGASAQTLSGGEAQRVALARALVLDPLALMLDEPTANLDPYNVGLIEKIIDALRKETGTTMVLVTHNIFQARRLADRVALLLEGRIVELADTDAFFNAPEDERTAAFVRGDMIY